METTLDAPPTEVTVFSPAPQPVDLLVALEGVQIDRQFEIANRYPRNLAQVKQRLISACTMDEETAAGCGYAVPRAGKVIHGPSIRHAELAFGAYGHLRVGTRIALVHSVGPDPHVIIQAVAFDVQNNTTLTMEKRRRIFKKKHKPEPDEDDINIAIAAAQATARRDIILQIIPRTITQPAYEQARRVAVGDIKSLAVRRQQVVDRLVQMGLAKPRIFTRIGVKTIEEIDLEKLGDLIGLGQALKNQEMSVEEAFPEPEVVEPVFQKAEAKPPRRARAATKDEPVPSPEPPPPAAPAAAVTPTATAEVEGAPADDPGDTPAPQPVVEKGTLLPVVERARAFVEDELGLTFDQMMLTLNRLELLKGVKGANDATDWTALPSQAATIVTLSKSSLRREMQKEHVPDAIPHDAGPPP